MTNFPFTKLKDINHMAYSNANLNRILIRRFPFLFDSIDPDDPKADCTTTLIAHYDVIKSRKSNMPAMQRMMIVDYVEKCREYGKEMK